MQRAATSLQAACVPRSRGAKHCSANHLGVDGDLHDRAVKYDQHTISNREYFIEVCGIQHYCDTMCSCFDYLLQNVSGRTKVEPTCGILDYKGGWSSLKLSPENELLLIAA